MKITPLVPTMAYAAPVGCSSTSTSCDCTSTSTSCC